MSLNMLQALQAIRDWFFPKVTLVQPEYEDGYQLCYGGARRHKTVIKSRDEYTFRCQYSIDPSSYTGKGRDSPAFPPLHFHRTQMEWFKVFQGRVGYVLDGKVGYATKGDVVEIGTGKIHTFWADPDGKEDAIMEFTVHPGEGLEEQWINSFYGVLDSYYRAGKQPGFLQMMVFIDQCDAAPGNVPKPVGLLMTYLFGRIIGRLAGYKGIYPEYCKGPPTAESSSSSVNTTSE